MSSNATTLFASWEEVFNAPRSAFFSGGTADTVFDRQSGAALSPHSEAMFTQSNARVLVGQSANGSFRLVAIPTRVFPAPTNEGEFGLGPGMYHRSDVVMYAGGLHYVLSLAGRSGEIDLAADERENRTWYADHFLPLTLVVEVGLEMHLLTFAPVAAEADGAALAPAPLPGPAGGIYALHLRNTGSETISGKIGLQAGDLLVGHYEDAEVEARPWIRPEVSLRQQTLILTRPFGAVGIHFHGAKWALGTAPYSAERAFSLAPGEEALFETHFAIAESYGDILPVIYQLHLHPALEWLSRTAAFWRSRLGALSVAAEGAGEEVQLMRDVYIRSLFDNFNCLQVNPRGDLMVHWQGAPSHGYGVCWGIDVEPTAGSIVHILPEMTRQTMLFFMNRSRAPIGPKDHSLPILVAPVILARLWLQATGDTAFLDGHPEVLQALIGIMNELIELKSPVDDLFPSRFSSDGPVGRRYDFGTNCKVLYAFDSLSYIFGLVGRKETAALYQEYAGRIRAAIRRRMVADGPFGAQISGGTNLGEDPAGFYLPEGQPYYDGEDTSSMLAAVYGACGLDWLPWINYHRFARSLWCPTYDPEFGTLNWFPSEPAVEDGTSFFSRLGGSVTPDEMKEAISVLRASGVDDATGSVFWWPHGMEYKRSLTRCSQGQGAWAWQYLQQWLGLQIDHNTQTLILAPQGLVTTYSWVGFRSAENCFDLAWEEGIEETATRVTNHNNVAWTLRVGFRARGAGALGELTWQQVELPAQGTATLRNPARMALPADSMTDAAVRRKETVAFSANPLILFRRYGPAMLWGHWDARKFWQPDELPNVLRFLVFNNSAADWEEVNVTLFLPDGWKAQPRQPRHWDRPDRFEAVDPVLSLGRLPAGQSIVAPFWLRAPNGKGLLSPMVFGGFGSQEFSSHMPSQPGEGIRLVSADLSVPQEFHLTAVLQAFARGAVAVEVKRDVPIFLEAPGAKKG